MKLVCTQENLTRALARVSRISSPRASLPILANLLFKTEKGGLKISSTDLEIGISTWIGAKIDQEGSITIPTRLISEFVSTNTDKNILIEKTDETLKFSSDHYTANIKGMPASEYPAIPEIKPESSFNLPTLVLQEAINQVAFATALDDTRPVLTGVLFKLEKSLVKIVATDSFRLAEKTISLPQPIANSQQFLAPARTLQEVYRILDQGVEGVKIIISSHQIMFDLGDTQIVSRLLDGEFPDYTQIIPTQKKTSLVLDRQEAISAIKMASFFARESANNIKFKLAKENHLQIIAFSPQLGDNVSRLAGQIQGEEVEISFNAKFLLDALAVLDEQKVIFELNGRFNPGVLKPEQAKDYLYIIMPLRLEE